MAVPSKKTRAPKATVKQVEFLIDYMQTHTAFATGKLLGVRGKAANDLQWQNLSEKLNGLEGPSKSVEGWKKVQSNLLFFCNVILSFFIYYIKICSFGAINGIKQELGQQRLKQILKRQAIQQIQ